MTPGAGTTLARDGARGAALAVAALISVVVAWVRVVDAGTPSGVAMTSDADFLYLPALWDDILHRGGRLADWAVPPSPYLLPDGLIFVVGRVLGGAWGGVVLAERAGQLVLFAVACFAWARWSRLPRPTAASLAVLTTAVVYGVLVVAPGPFARLAPITNHGGVAIAGSIWLGGLVVTIVNGARGDHVALLVTTGVLLACSDGLFDGAFVVPSLVLVVLVGVAGPPALRGDRTLRLVMVPLGAAVGGLILARLLPMYVPTPFGPKLDPAQWSDQLELIYDHWRAFSIDAPLVAGGWLVLLVASTARAVGALRRLAEADVADLLAIAVPLVVITDVAAVAVVGVLSPDPAFTRYLLPGLLAPLIGLAPLLWPHPEAPGLPRPGRRALAGVLAAATLVAVMAGPAQAIEPPQLACLDDLARTHDLRYGISDYWQAKPITVWSDTGLVVGSDMVRLPEVQNRAWSQRPGYDFAVIDLTAEGRHLLDEDLLRQRGEVIDTVDCGTWRVMIYGDPKLVIG